MENIIAESCENSKFPFLSRLISFLLQKAEQTKHNVFLIDFFGKKKKEKYYNSKGTLKNILFMK